MRIIPAIDIIDGKCVRLTKGKYDTKKIYNENPLEVAKQFEDSGIKYLHLVDLDGARQRKIINQDVLAAIANNTNLKIDFGGGIKHDEDARIAFESGAVQITAGSIAIQEPNLFKNWLETFGNEKIILGADCRDRMIATQGWLENSNKEVTQFINDYRKVGVDYVICTDISKDGMLQGSSNKLYTEILSKTDVKLIASGGVSSIEDLRELKSIGCEGAIIGKAIYEGFISLNELQELC